MPFTLRSYATHTFRSSPPIVTSDTSLLRNTASQGTLIFLCSSKHTYGTVTKKEILT